MSTVEATATPVPVEEVKPTETAPVTESSAPAAEAPKVEEVASPVSFLCYSVSFLCLLLFSYFFSPLLFIRRPRKKRPLR
jgi:hypothetical protein